MNFENENNTGLNQEQINNMSDSELKAYQRGQSDDELSAINEKIKFSHVSLILFALCAIVLYTNPITGLYLFVAPAILATIFLVRLPILEIHLKNAKKGRNMLEMFFEDMGI